MKSFSNYLKWILIGIFVCSLIGAIIGGVKIIYLQKADEPGDTISHECLLWDKECVDKQNKKEFYLMGVNCCIESCKESKISIRLRDYVLKYSLIGASVGVLVGFLLFKNKK